ncbi:MAG: rhamnulokinase [Clostridiales bacterium]|nr:rhamnulokinase [Clostridiales bacterium]
MSKRVLAFDFGASSGRAMLGEFDGEKITLKELHRFSNDPVSLNGTLYWDTLRLFHEIKQGILKAKLNGGFDSIGINTWGVDFGLLDKDGRLLESSVNYRDDRTTGMLKQVEKIISKEKLYEKTGVQIMEINTAFQLTSLVKNQPSLLKNAETMLMTPDLFNYFLTGKKVTERSIASTTQLLNHKTGDWDFELVEVLGIPKNIFTQIIDSGTIVGQLSDEICHELGVKSVPVIAVCGHDTQDAVVATPAKDKDFIFVSCGTWSLFGTELEKPIVNNTTHRLNITNEMGYQGTTNLLNNIIGLWLIQESRRQWAREGQEYSYAQLEKLALESEPFKCFINPDYPAFTPMGNIPRQIREYYEKTNQRTPETVGEVVRCIYESLSMKYRYSLNLIKEATNKEYETIHIVGGGAKDGLLCQMTSDACGIKVVSGPIEATVLGNVAIQLMAHGEISDVWEARKIIEKSANTKTFKPVQGESINETQAKAYERFIKIMHEK